MKRLIYGVVGLSISLAGCLHHKSKKEKHLKSLEKQIQPVVEKYKEEKKNEDVKVAQEPFQEVKEDPKEEFPPQVVPPTLEDIKKNLSRWWNWE